MVVAVAQVLALTFIVVMALVVALWLLSMPLSDVSIIDMAFSALIAGVLLTAYRWGQAGGIIPDLIISEVTQACLAAA